MQPKYFQKKVYNNTGLPQEMRKISDKQLILYLKELEKEQTKPKDSGKKKMIKIRAEINKIQTKKTTEKNNETQIWFFEKVKWTKNWLDSPRKKQKTQVNKIRNYGKVTMDIIYTQRIMKEYQ